MTSREREDSSPRRPQRKAGRTERLAAALRANLRRRKAQARGRGAAQKTPRGGK